MAKPKIKMIAMARVLTMRTPSHGCLLVFIAAPILRARLGELRLFEHLWCCGTSCSQYML
jgi:hypothetical protein